MANTKQGSNRAASLLWSNRVQENETKEAQLTRDNPYTSSSRSLSWKYAWLDSKDQNTVQFKTSPKHHWQLQVMAGVCVCVCGAFSQQ